MSGIRDLSVMGNNESIRIIEKKHEKSKKVKIERKLRKNIFPLRFKKYLRISVYTRKYFRKYFFEMVWSLSRILVQFPKKF